MERWSDSLMSSFFTDVAHGSKIGLISNLVVDERFRGRGLGEELLRERFTTAGTRAP